MKYYLFCKTHLKWNDEEVPMESVGEWLLATKAAVELDVNLWRTWLMEHESCDVTVKGQG